MAINFAAASTAGLNNPGTEIITLVKDVSGNFINPPSYDKMLAYLRSGDVPCLFVTSEAGTTGDIYQLSGYSETENKIRFAGEKTAIEFSEGSEVPSETEIGGGGVEITDGIVVKAFTSNNFPASVKVYCSSNTLWKYALAGGRHSLWNSLTSAEIPENLTDFSDNYVFYQSSLTEITLPNAVNVGYLTFYDCKSLKHVNLPKCNILGKETFVSGAVYETINIGSIGYPCTSINNTAFKNHPYSDTITVYTTGAYADTALTNIRNGATNATIIIKASEDTTYNGVAYAAGNTMITSEVQ